MDGRRRDLRGSVTVVALVAVALVLAAGGVIVGLGGDDAGARSLTVGDAWTAPNQSAAAVYLTIDNAGREDRLVGATAELAGAASLMGGDAAVAHPAADGEAIQLAIPVGVTELHPGGRHLMLEDLTRELAAGDRFRLQLEFDHAGPITTTVEVVDRVAR